MRSPHSNWTCVNDVSVSFFYYQCLSVNTCLSRFLFRDLVIFPNGKLWTVIEAVCSLQVGPPVGVIAQVRIGIIKEQLAATLKKDNSNKDMFNTTSMRLILASVNYS